MSARKVVCVVGLWLIPGIAPAQFRGTVRDDSGKPVAGALVELWSPTQRLGGAVSAADGGFAFEPSVTRDAAALLVRAVGYGMLRTSVTVGDTAVSLRLSLLTSQVAPLVVTGSRRACDNRDEPAARDLWHAAAQRYDLRFTWAVEDTVRIVASRVPFERLGVVDTAAWTLGMLGWSGDFFRLQTARIKDHGYAVRSRGLVQAWYDSWDYAALESNLAPHFVDSLFGRMHRLSVRQTGPLGTEVRFCPRRRDTPHIDGTMLIGPDTSLVKAEWHFYTPEPDEYAGGEVAFTPRWSGNGAAQPAMPITGLFYRRGVRDFYQVWLDHRHWYVCKTERLERCNGAGVP